MINLYSIIVGLFAAAGAIVAIWSWKSIRKKKSTGSWIPTEATITESIESSREHDFLPLVKFSYEINGNEYEGNIEIPLGEAHAPDFAQRFTSDHPVNSKITVYYKPDEPQKNTLTPGANKEDWLIFGIGVATCIFGLGFIAINL